MCVIFENDCVVCYEMKDNDEINDNLCYVMLCNEFIYDGFVNVFNVVAYRFIFFIILLKFIFVIVLIVFIVFVVLFVIFVYVFDVCVFIVCVLCVKNVVWDFVCDIMYVCFSDGLCVNCVIMVLYCVLLMMMCFGVVVCVFLCGVCGGCVFDIVLLIEDL